VRPILFKIPLPWGGTFPLHSFGLMIVLGFLLGCWVAGRESRRRGLPDFIHDLGLVMLLTGIFGGRLFYFVQFHDEEFAGKSFLEFFKIWKGGLVFYGGAITGFLGGLAYCLLKKLPLADALDIASLGTPVAMGIGRLGCFLNGCCFGKVCDPGTPLALTYPPGSLAQLSHLHRGLLTSPSADSLPVLPVQIYQGVHDLLLFGLLFWYFRRPEAPRGSGMPLLFVLYGLGRFLLEGLRGDHQSTFTGLTLSQNLSLLLTLGFGTVSLLKGAQRPI
jgi:phosphatidylglycerol:prolipoprotein diacylglycerol transferase